MSSYDEFKKFLAKGGFATSQSFSADDLMELIYVFQTLKKENIKIESLRLEEEDLENLQSEFRNNSSIIKGKYPLYQFFRDEFEKREGENNTRIIEYIYEDFTNYFSESVGL